MDITSNRSLNDSIELFENDRATHYENFVDTWIPNYRFFINILPKLLKNVTEKKLLVVGCGTGNEILSLCKTLPKCEITGVDPSKDMLEQATKIIINFPKVNLIHGTVDKLPTNNKFAAASLALVLHFMPNDEAKLNLLYSIQKRLSANAPLIILDITGEGTSFDKNLEILSQIVPHKVAENEKTMRIKRIKNELYCISENKLSYLIQKAGFTKPVQFFQSTIYKGWITYKK